MLIGKYKPELFKPVEGVEYMTETCLYFKRDYNGTIIGACANGIAFLNMVPDAADYINGTARIFESDSRTIVNTMQDIDFRSIENFDPYDYLYCEINTLNIQGKSLEEIRDYVASLMPVGV